MDLSLPGCVTRPDDDGSRRIPVLINPRGGSAEKVIDLLRADARFIVAAGDAASTVRLPFPLPPATELVMRPYDLEELRILLED